MAPKSALVPLGVVALNKGMFASAYKPVTVNYQKAAAHVSKAYVLPARNLSRVLGESPLQRGFKCLARVHDLLVPVECVHTFFRWSHFLRERVRRTGLKLLDQLSREGLIELKEECMFVTRTRGLADPAKR
jgi:hypothetical protein